VQTLIDIIHVIICLFLMLVILLQQGKGGGMGAAFGGGAAQQVFGGRGAGNILTRATAICATIFMLTSLTLAAMSRSGDSSLSSYIKQAEEERNRGQGDYKHEDIPSPSSTPSGAESAPSGAESAPPAPVPAPSNSQ